MDKIDFIGFSLIALIVLWLGFVIGGAYGEVNTLKDYCQSQSLEYQMIDSEYYCYGDNQLYPIEWMNE